MPLPKPDRTKVRKVVHHKQTELYQGPPYIKEKERSMDNPGGGGIEDQAWWKLNRKEQQLIGTKNFEYKLNKAFRKYERVMGIASKKNITLAPLRDHNKS